MNKSSTLRSALVAIGGSLAAVPASALELGEANVQSALGQPLRASIAYALGPNEALSDSCVTVRPANGASGIPSTDRGTLVIGNGQIEYTSNSVVREPLFTIQVAINCHYTARLSRDYMLFIDPVSAAPETAAAPERVAAQTRVATPPARRAPAVVQQPAAIPRTATEKTPVAEPVISSPESTAYEPADIPDVAAEPAIEVPVITTSRSSLDELQPGDVIIPAANPNVEPAATTRTEPVVVPEPQSIIRQPETAPGSSWMDNWLLWLGGGAAAFALFFIGRLLRDRFGSSPIAPTKPRREPAASEPEPVEAQVETQVEAMTEVDIEIDDDSPTAENLALDADLLEGTGLQEGAEVEVAQDFDFASTTDLDLDLELPEEAAEATEVPMTDILPPLHADESEILDSEVLPEDDEYDFSVMLDATKMPNPDDVTERDLEAIQVDDDDDTLIGNDYTVSNEVDYKVLEQDYEDEVTATQALNEEIMKAAEDAAVNDELDITAEVAANDLPKRGKKVS